MGLTRTSAASADPITIDELRKHLAIEHSDDDAYLGSVISAATRQWERETQLQLMPATYEYTMDLIADATIYLPIGPVRSITSITYYDASDVLQTLDASKYTLVADQSPAYLWSASWPATYSRPNAVKITIAAGYADRSSIPIEIKHDLKIDCATAYTYRLGYGTENIRRNPIQGRAAMVYNRRGVG